MNNSPRNRQILNTKESACKAVQRMLNGNDTHFEMVLLLAYKKRQVALPALQGILRFMSCKHNSFSWLAGLLVCKIGWLSTKKNLHSFRTVRGGTSRVERHTATHKTSNTILRFQRQLPLAAKSKIAHAAAYAVSLDFRPLSFCDGHDCIRVFAKSIFEMGHSVPGNESLYSSGYLPGRIAVTNAVRDLRNKLRTKFVAERKDGLLQFGGAVTVDGVHLKLQRKHYYDFTLNFLEVKENGPFSDDSFFLQHVTLLLIDIPAIASAWNIGKALNDALVQKYNTLLDKFPKRFTVVTGSAAVMARVANASVSREIHALDENRMRCMAHILNNSMKTVMSQCKKAATLSVVAEDFRAMKKIIEDANRAGWNYLLPNGYKLKQECQTRLGTYYQVTKRFLKSDPKGSLCVENLHGSAVQEAFFHLKRRQILMGPLLYIPELAIFHVFGIVLDCLERFETSQRSTLQIALPSLYKMFHKLDDVSKD